MLEMMQQMPQHEGQYDEVVAQVDFNLSDHPNPKKQRRQNIKRAMKALKPLKGKILFFRYRRHKSNQCVCDSTNCLNADYGDLFDQYFRDPQTMQVRPFRPWSGVLPGRGRQLEGTYCPQHMMLYHRLMEWIEQEEAETDPNFFTRMAKKGVAFVPVKRGEKKEEHPLIVKWTPIFIEAQKDGLQIVHYTNPLTGENDITMIVFDNRVLQHTAPTGTVLKSGMDMAQYHQVIEQMGRQG